MVKDKYVDIGDWSSAIDVSEPADAPGEVGVGTARTCSTTLGTVKETVVVLDDESHTLTFRADWMPWFIKLAQNTFQLRALDAGRTQVTMDGEVRIKGALIFMLPMMRMKVGRIVTSVLGDLKTYVETGKVHERKTRSLKCVPRKHRGPAAA